MLRGLAIVFAVLLVTGCQKQEPAPRALPKIPPGFESKPGTGGMGMSKAGKKQAATDNAKAKAETKKDKAAPDQAAGDTDKKQAAPSKPSDAAKADAGTASGGPAAGEAGKKK